MTLDDLLVRHGGAVPRYTSYPPTPCFGQITDPAPFFARLAALAPETEISLYLHVPFCQALCLFCGCHTTIGRDPDLIARYAASLRREIDLLAEAIGHRVTLRHVHWGGGTPSILGPADLIATMEHLSKCFSFAPGCEIAIELDPRRASPALLAALRTMGVTRASLGVQDFDPRVQEAVKRIQPAALVAGVIETLRGAGIGSINLDLMYGLPYQSATSVAATASQAVSLHPDRLAVFGYAHVPWLMAHQRLLPENELPQARARYEQQQAVADVLTSAGYQPIGLDHFARPDDALVEAAKARRLKRNFQGYTDDAAPTLLGLGASAISSFADAYAQNTARIGEWMRAVESGRLPVQRGLRLSPDDLLRRDVIEQLMCFLEVDLADLAASHSTPLAFLLAPELESFAADGLIRWDGRHLAVTQAGRPFLRTIAAAFDAVTPKQSAIPRYSRAF